MPNELQSRDGMPRKDKERPSSPSSQDYRGYEKNPSNAGDLGAPGPGMSDRNGPSDPYAKRNR
jgi:hypothetical protein